MKRKLAAFFCGIFVLTVVLSDAFAAAGGDKMDRVAVSEKNRLKAARMNDLSETDPDLVLIRDRLVYGEIQENSSLDIRQTAVVIMAALTAIQALDEIGPNAMHFLDSGVSALDLREAVYQCAPYVGYPKVEAVLKILNPVFIGKGETLPLASQGTVMEDNRMAAGLATQKGIFGKHIDDMRANAPEGQKELVTNYLTAWCFGDHYTRGSLDLKLRELVTFSAIVALGGCDPQARAHASGNIAVGNDKQTLIDALSVMLPLIGFPRTLNGLAAVNAAIPEPRGK